MKKFTSPKQKIGLVGEKSAELFLVKQGFQILDRNFSTRFGEIDFIAEKAGRMHFIEVKTITVSRLPAQAGETINECSNAVTHLPAKAYASAGETLINNKMGVPPACPAGRREMFIKENRKLNNPFQNISYFKVKRHVKTAEIYMNMHNVSRETRWQVDGVGVFLDTLTSQTTFQYLPNLTIL